MFNSFAIRCRLATLTAYGGSLIIFHHAELLAGQVYDALCSREGIMFAKPTSATSLAWTMVLFSVPPLLARGRPLILFNLAAGLLTAAASGLLLSTASGTPYECFTMGGSYEDHTSGLDEFMLWGAFVLVSSFILLFIDLLIWAARKLAAARRATSVAPTQPQS